MAIVESQSPVKEGEIMEPRTEALAKRLEKADSVFGLTLLEFAKIAAASGYFPSVKSVSQAAIKIALGRDMGLGATQALKNLYIVTSDNGNQVSIGVKGEQMAASIRASGKYDYEVVEDSEKRAEIRFFRLEKGKPKLLGSSSYTIEEAQKANLAKKHETHASDHLFWRAMSRGQRRHCPDIFQGHTVYVDDELREITDGKMDEPRSVEFTEIPESLVASFGRLKWTRGQIEMWLAQHKGQTVEQQAAALDEEIKKSVSGAQGASGPAMPPVAQRQEGSGVVSEPVPETVPTKTAEPTQANLLNF